MHSDGTDAEPLLQDPALEDDPPVEIEGQVPGLEGIEVLQGEGEEPQDPNGTTLDEVLYMQQLEAEAVATTDDSVWFPFLGGLWGYGE